MFFRVSPHGWPPLRAPVVALAVALVGIGCIGDPPGLTEQEQTALAPYISDSASFAHERSIDFGSNVRLVGYSLEPPPEKLAPGASITLTMVWQCNAPMPAGTLQFTHLTDGAGRLIQNLDGAGAFRKMPGKTGAPLAPSRWKQGKFYSDVLRFDLPDETGGSFEVRTGFYRGKHRTPPAAPHDDGSGRATVVKLSVPQSSKAKTGHAGIKELSIPKLPTDTTIVINGELDEPIWKQAAATGPFVNVQTGRPATGSAVQGRARLLWDPEFLYVAFEVEDQKLTGGFSDASDDPHLWERDTVEIMIDPDGDGDGRDYYEIQINPQNLRFDSQFDQYNAPRGGPAGPFGHEDWSSKATHAVKLHGTLDEDGDTDRGYQVEAQFPWTAFAKARHTPPKLGTKWRMNFYAMENNGGVAWSPILGQGNFHRASRFGRVIWAGPPSP